MYLLIDSITLLVAQPHVSKCHFVRDVGILAKTSVCLRNFPPWFVVHWLAGRSSKPRSGHRAMPGCCTRSGQRAWLLYRKWAKGLVAVQEVGKGPGCCTGSGQRAWLLYKKWAKGLVAVQEVGKGPGCCTRSGQRAWLLYRKWAKGLVAVQEVGKGPGCCTGSGQRAWLLYKKWAKGLVAVQEVGKGPGCCTRSGQRAWLLYKKWAKGLVAVQIDSSDLLSIPLAFQRHYSPQGIQFPPFLCQCICHRKI